MAGKNSKPFRQTKKLIRLALDDAWTQTAIAEKARVQQSIVSGWANGKTEAKLHQIEFLLEEYGDKLRKLSTTVYSTQYHYYEIDPALVSLFEIEGFDKTLLEGKDTVAQADVENLICQKHRYISDGKLSELTADSTETLTQVQAPIIFKFIFQQERMEGKNKRKLSIERWNIHKLGGQQFLLAIQTRRELTHQQLSHEELRCRVMRNAGVKVVEQQSSKARYVHSCNDESAHWNTNFIEYSAVEHMINEVDSRLNIMTDNAEYAVQDLITLPFLLKKALLNQNSFEIAGQPQLGRWPAQ